MTLNPFYGTGKRPVKRVKDIFNKYDCRMLIFILVS